MKNQNNQLTKINQGEILTKQFKGQKVEIIMKDGEPLFELYSTGMALGQVKKNSAGKLYPRKDRINENVKSAEISTVLRNAKLYININGLRKLISTSNTKNKNSFIEWLKLNNYIKQEEVFEFTRKEEIFINALERILTPIGYSLEKQKIDNNYRFDGYIPELDMVVEYDENGHLHYDLNKEIIREKYIKANYLYLVRVSDFQDLMTNIGIVIKKIMEVA